MHFLNKNRPQVAYFAALTLLFSYAEMLLPRVVPFFRLGLGNIAVLAAFFLDFPSFLVLTVIKALAASLMAGTLFSPFVLISLAQSVFSGALMYVVFHLNRLCSEKLFSVYGLSVLGSAASAVIQILLSALYLGSGTWSLLGPMLIFNSVSGIVTAFLCEKMELGGRSDVLFSSSLSKIKLDSEASLPLVRTSLLSTPSMGPYEHSSSGDSLQTVHRTVCLTLPTHNALFTVSTAILLLVAAAGVFFIKSIPVLCGAMVLAFILQKISGRKIFLVPHLTLWIFVLLTSVLIPEGKVIFKLWNFSVTQGALLSGIVKALKLSAVSALSQCAAGLRPSEKTLLGLSLAMYRSMLDKFHSEKGNLWHRVKAAVRG